MFLHTLVLSLTATITGAVLAAASFDTGRPWLPVALAAALGLPAAASLWRGSLRWREAERRARVVAAVSAG